MQINNSLVKAEKEKQTFSTFMTSEGVRNKVNSIIGGKDGQRFITAIISAVSINPSLSKCEPSSILSAALLGETLKLTPSPQLGHYYMVPYDKKDKTTGETISTAQFQLGYKGYLQLAIRSGYYKKINVLAIKEGELVKYDPLNEEIEVNLIQDDIEREKVPTIGYYAMFEYMNGFIKAMYWSIEKMEIHANTYSKAFNLDSYKKLKAGKIPEKDMWKYSSFWYKDFDGMAYKTMLRQLISKWGIMSIEMQTAIENDMAVIKENGQPDYVDNVVIEPTVEEVKDSFFEDSTTINATSEEVAAINEQ